MKYTNMEKKLGRFVVIFSYGFILFLISSLLLGLLVIDFFYGILPISILWFLLLPGFGIILNWFIGRMCGDKFYNTGIVVDGDSVYDIEKTPKYYKRRMYISFIQCGIFGLLGLRYILSIMLGMYMYIILLIGCIIAIVIYVILGLSSYEQSGMKEEKTNKKQNQNKQGIQVVFDFNTFPNLKDLYDKFKYWNTMKERASNENDKVEAMIHANESMDELAEDVYNTFYAIKPNLIYLKTKEVVCFNYVIDKPFEKLSYKQRLILARLLDGSYLYKLPEKYYEEQK